jgi:hypothetical protein
MKSHRSLRFIIPLLLLFAALGAAQTHVPEPAVNLGDTSFLDGIARPGIVVEEIGDGTHSSGIVERGQLQDCRPTAHNGGWPRSRL